MMTDKVHEYSEKHIGLLAEWEHGEPVGSWIDNEGFLCIIYEDGAWWHYKVENNKLIWW